MNAVQEELGSSKMPSMAYSQSILAASGTPVFGAVDGEAPEDPNAGTVDEGAQQQVPQRRSVAFDTIEKSMQIIDSTLAVMQSSVKELDDKFKRQVIFNLNFLKVDFLNHFHCVKVQLSITV